MKGLIKTLVASIGIILLITYLLTGLFPFQKQVIMLLSKNYMNKTYPDFELTEVRVYFDFIGNGYDITCYSSDKEEWKLGWVTYPPFSWGIIDSTLHSRINSQLNAYVNPYTDGINTKIKSLLENDSFGFSSSVGVNLSDEELIIKCNNQEELDNEPLIWGSSFDSIGAWTPFVATNTELWTTEQFAYNIWQSIKTLAENGIKFQKISIMYMQKTGPVYDFSWDNTMGPLTEDTVISYIRELNYEIRK